MKNIITKIIIGCVVVGACGFLYWYYDSGGGLGAVQGVGVQNDDDGTQNSDTAIVDMPTDGAGTPATNDGPDSASSAAGVDVAASSPLDQSDASSPADDDSATSATSVTSIAPASSSESVDAQNSSDASGSDSASTASSVSPQPLQACSFSGASGTPSREIILNEIAWMGSLPAAGETSAKASEREWIELRNISSSAIDLSGWQILDSGSLKIIVATSSAEVQPGGFYLLVRDGQSIATPSGVAIPADAGYSGAMPNAGDKLALFDADCGVSDFLDASTGWPGGDNATKATMERDADGTGWHTSAEPGGTPRAENSAPPTPTPPLMPAAQSQSVISVALPGAGIGVVSSSPAGILCGSTCEGNFAVGTKLSFVATPADGSLFNGWSGACSGAAATCSFVVSSSATLAADFEKIPPATSTASSDSSGENSSSSESGSASTHLLIAQIQIAGGVSSNDFVKIFNPTGAAVDLSGWKLHKKSSTGTDYSLKTFVTGSTIAPGGYFAWANSEDGFADSIGADASSTETLSADNSVALFDANGDIVDQVAWGTGTGQYVEGSAYPTDPTAGQILARQSAGGVMVDTDDNGADFGIR